MPHRSLTTEGSLLTDQVEQSQLDCDSARTGHILPLCDVASSRKDLFDYVLTYAATFGLMVAGVVTFRIANQHFGEIGLSQFAIVRRALAFILPFLALGLAVSLSHKVAASRFEFPRINEIPYLFGALVLACISMLLFLIPLFLFPEWIAYAVFGSSQHANYSYALAPMVVGMGLHIVCYAHFRGTQSMKIANLIQVINLAIIPLIAMLIAPNIRGTFVITGIAVAVVSLIAIAIQFCKKKESIGNIKMAFSRLLRYGLPRVPGDTAFAALFMLPAAIATHSSGILGGGLVAFSIALLTFAQATVAPISTIILPQATEMLRDGRKNLLRAKVVRLLLASFVVTSFGIMVYYYATDFLLGIWLGTYSEELPGISRIMLLGALPLNWHICLRSIVDAGTDRAINGRNAFLSLICLVPLIYSTRLFANDFVAIPLALVITLGLMAFLTSYETWKILRPESNQENNLINPLKRNAA